jgi:protein gp37
MYDWVTHTWSPIIGCPHQCEYCYVKAFRNQPVEPQLRDDFPPLGSERIIFVGHLCDMFAVNVPVSMIRRVLNHCCRYPSNQYVFQTKNPGRLFDFEPWLPDSRLLGTTIETDKQDILGRISNAPAAADRSQWMRVIHSEKFITIEPIMAFNLGPFVDLIVDAAPSFVNIGADSKKHNLVEPTAGEVQLLIEALEAKGIKIRKKTNLDRFAEVK